MIGVDYYTKELRKLLNDHFNGINPPECEVTLKKQILLAKIAQYNKNILFSVSENPINLDQAKLIDLGYRIILHDYTELSELSKNASQALQNAPTEYQKLKTKIQELETQNDEWKSKYENLQERANGIQEELDAANKEKENVEKLKQELSAKIKEEINKINIEKSNLDDELGRLANDNYILQERCKRYESVIEQIKSDCVTLEEENKKLNEKISKKSQRIKEAQNAIEQQQITIAGLEAKQEELNDIINKQNIEQTRKVALIKLQTEWETINGDLEAFKKQRDKAVLLIEKLLKVVNRYSKIASSNDTVRAEYNRKITDLQEQIEDYREENEDLKEDQKEFDQIRNILIESLHALQPQYTITADQLPETIRQIISNPPQNETEETHLSQSFEATSPMQNRDLSSLMYQNPSESSPVIDNLTRFLINILKKGEIQSELLKEPISIPIVGDKNLKLDALSALEEVRQDWQEINGEFDSNDQNDIFAKLMKIKNLNISNQEEMSNTLILCFLIQNLSHRLKDITNAMRNCKKVLPVHCTDDKLPLAISEYLVNLKDQVDNLLPIINKTMDLSSTSVDSIDAVTAYVKSTAGLIQQLDSKVRPIVNFGGRITDIAQSIIKYLEDHKEQMNRDMDDFEYEYQGKASQLEERLKKLKKQVDEQKATIRSKNLALAAAQTEMLRYKEQVKQANEQIQKANDDVETIKEENVELHNNYQSILEQLTKMNEELAFVKEDARKKREANQQKASALLENERIAKHEEIELLNQKHEKERKILSEEMGKKEEKINKLKLEIKTLKDEMAKKEQEAKLKITELQQENQTTSRYAEENDAVCNARIQQLQDQVESLKKQNQNLTIDAMKRSQALSSLFMIDTTVQTDERFIGQAKNLSDQQIENEWQQWAQNLVTNKITGRQRKLPTDQLRKRIEDAVASNPTPSRLRGSLLSTQ